MKRRFFDLHVFPNEKNLKEMVNRARELGFKALGCTVKDRSGLKALKGILVEEEPSEIQVLTRLDLRPSVPERFFAEVKRARGSFDITAAECLTRKDIITATRSRVDILFLEPGAILGLREGDFKPLAVSQKFLEFNLCPLLRKRGPERVRELSYLMSCLDWLLKLKVPIILSSGAKEPLDMRSPLDIASFFSLTGLSLEEGLKGLSKNPRALLEILRAEKDPEGLFPSLI